jgi:hypothetical protein
MHKRYHVTTSERSSPGHAPARANGTATCWGANTDGKATPPIGFG